MPDAKGIDETHPPGHAESAVKWLEWFQGRDLEDLCQGRSP